MQCMPTILSSQYVFEITEYASVFLLFKFSRDYRKVE